MHFYCYMVRCLLYHIYTVVRARTRKCQEPVVFVEIIIILPLRHCIFEGLVMHENLENWYWSQNWRKLQNFSVCVSQAWPAGSIDPQMHAMIRTKFL